MNILITKFRVSIFIVNIFLLEMMIEKITTLRFLNIIKSSFLNALKNFD